MKIIKFIIECVFMFILILFGAAISHMFFTNSLFTAGAITMCVVFTVDRLISK